MRQPDFVITSRNKIREILYKKGWTATDLSVKSGLHLNTIYEIKDSKKATCRRSTAKIICSVLGMKLCAVFPEEDDVIDEKIAKILLDARKRIFRAMRQEQLKQRTGEQR